VSARPATWSPRVHQPEYVDHVVRKEQFLAAHPGAVITSDRDAPPHQHWRGLVPGCDEATSWDLGQLLDQLDSFIAVRDALVRWPRWTFTRTGFVWQAREMDGQGLVDGSTLAQVEARVSQRERSTQSSDSQNE
jgi:hypothetical protein